MDKIGKHHPAYAANMDAWRLPLALMGGTRALRTGAGEFLPQYPREELKAYQDRVAAAVLYNAFKRTVRVLSSKPFAKPVALDKVPTQLAAIELDADRARMNLGVFARRQLWDLLTCGLSHYLVEMPAFEPGTLTRADEVAKNVHPYFCRVRPEQLINWEFIETDTGEQRLEEIQIQSEFVDDQARTRKRIDRWTTKTIERWVQEPTTANGSAPRFALEGAPRVNPLNRIPLVTRYADASFVDAMQAECPLEDLAHLNLRHFRSLSDQDTALHYARVPFLHFAGFEAAEIKATIAASNAYASKNPAAQIRWVEPTGAALEQGFRDLQTIEARMDVMGADLLTQRPGNPTATARSIDAAEKVSDLQAMVAALESGIEEGYTIAGEWVALKGVAVQVKLFKDFGLSLKEAAELDMLLKARIAGELSRPTWLAELARRGIVEDLDVKAEAAALEAEGKFDDNTPNPEAKPAPAE